MKQCILLINCLVVGFSMMSRVIEAAQDVFLQMIEDAEIVSRFARGKLELREIVVGGAADDVLLARAIVECVPGLQPAPELPERGRSWSEIVEQQSELWPICYLLPGGAYIR